MKKINFDKIFFYFIIIDIMFLPYFRIISTNYSLPIVYIWFIIRWKNIKRDFNEGKTFLCMFFISILSTLISFLLFPRYLNDVEIYIKNINLLIQYTSYLIYFEMFKYYIKKYHPNLNKILLLYVFFNFIMCLLYYYDKNLFANIKLYWNNVDYFTNSFLNGTLYAVYRYNFIWTDPNNVAYGIIALNTYIINQNDIKKSIKILFFLFQIVIVIATMSLGGIVSLLLVTALFILTNYKKIFSKKNIKSNLVIVLFIIITIVCIKVNYSNLQNNITYKESIERITNNSSGSESRINIWKNIIKNINISEYILLGKGGQTVVNNKVIKPHSGHFLMFLSYGIIYYILFLKTYYYVPIKKIREYLFVIPIFIGFTINTLIGEQKLFIIYILLYVLKQVKSQEGDK